MAALILGSCRDRTSFAPNVRPTPMPGFSFNGILATYNNPSVGHKETSTLGLIELARDHNSIEFPNSPTTVMATTEEAAAEGVGFGRALKLAFTMQYHSSPAASCAIPSLGCDCAGGGSPSAPAYSYVSVSHQFAPEGTPGLDLSAYTKVSFWMRSAVAFQVKLALNCDGEARPLGTVAPTNGYVDAAFTIKNPCWYAAKSQREPGLPIWVVGDNAWHKYELPLSGFSDTSAASQPPPNGTSTLLPCGINRIRSFSLTWQKGTAPATGDFPLDSGVLYLDDLVFE